MIERDVKIVPFAPQQLRPGTISWGVSSYGYDARLGHKFRVMTPHRCTNTVIDPKQDDPSAWEYLDYTPDDFKGPHQWDVTDARGVYRCKRCGTTITANAVADGPCVIHKPDHLVIPPHSFVLGETLETFTIPRDVLCLVMGKSTYARTGVIVTVTPGEPEWTGKWTVEISNTGPMPVKVYCGEGIMQCVFVRAEAGCRTSYADKKGKYQDQSGLTPAKAD